MKVSGVTVVRNAIKFNYPAVESIKAILPVCDEFIVNVGESEDETLKLINSIQNPRIKIIQTKWDLSQGPYVLAFETNRAIKECTGDWIFYAQADELFHEGDLSKLRLLMEKYHEDPEVDALRFQWMHFFGSYYRYRIDFGWFQKQDRIIRNNGQIESFGDAFGFKRKDGKALKSKKTYCLLYHYGWVHSGEMMTQRRVNHEAMGFHELDQEQRKEEYQYGNLDRFPAYFGSHPKVMQDRVANHFLSQMDWKDIKRKYWWHPGFIFRLRYKTWRRVKRRIE